MPDSDERIEKDLKELVAWLVRCRDYVDFLRDRIGNDFPAEMIEQSVPASFAYNTDCVLGSVAEEIDDMIGRLRKAARKTPTELHASWTSEQSEGALPERPAKLPQRT